MSFAICSPIWNSRSHSPDEPSHAYEQNQTPAHGRLAQSRSHAHARRRNPPRPRRPGHLARHGLHRDVEQSPGQGSCAGRARGRGLQGRQRGHRIEHQPGGGLHQDVERKVRREDLRHRPGSLRQRGRRAHHGRRWPAASRAVAHRHRREETALHRQAGGWDTA